nr:cytotoxic translational repressor of toxin-antitoxin stability system [Arthrobacter sp. StoSoilB13]
MSQKYPPGTRDDHETFCRTEEWQPVPNAKGQKVRHHATYELALHDGRILRTRISRPVDRTAYGPSLWGEILKNQLDVTPDEFWGCVKDGDLPDRGLPEAPTTALPLELVILLTKTAKIPEATVATMSKEEAVQAMNAYWTSTVTPGK